MKTKPITILLLAAALMTANTSCRKTFLPSTAIDENSALTNAGDIETATIGTYALFKNPAYVRSGHFLMEYPGDEIAQGQNSSDDLTRAYQYTHLVTSAHATNFWGQAYIAISAANRIIEKVDDHATPDLLQLKGENLFIRGMLHFNLVRIFGRPYPQGAETNPGVPILKDGLTDSAKLILARSTVKEVYDFVITDLLKAAELMTINKSNSFASKAVAWALLSRVYLYKEDNQKAIEYATKLIESGEYALLSGSDFGNYFRNSPDGNSETIFCIRHMKTEDRDFGAIGSMYFSGDASGNPQNQGYSGWGEIYASQKYMDFLNLHPTDRRHAFISDLMENGVIRKNTKLTPNTPMHYINKYCLQEGIVNLSSPVYLRLAEIHLNRAEANAKLGNLQEALDDVNKLRERAGIPQYTLDDLAAAGKTALDIVLEERWLELAFEGHRAYDLYRNNRPVVRNYPGTHATGGNVNKTYLPSDNRVIFFIPQSEIDKNKNLTQNP